MNEPTLLEYIILSITLTGWQVANFLIFYHDRLKEPYKSKLHKLITKE